MTKITIDTERLENASIEIKNILTQMDIVLKEYVNKMNKVPTETKEWQGNASEQFMEIITNDYNNKLVPFMDNIRKYADEMHLEATEYQNISMINRL